MGKQLNNNKIKQINKCKHKIIKFMFTLIIIVN